MSLFEEYDFSNNNPLVKYGIKVEISNGERYSYLSEKELHNIFKSGNKSTSYRDFEEWINSDFKKEI